jgi:hypothetical protein
MSKVTARDFMLNILDNIDSPSVKEAVYYTTEQKGTDEEMYQNLVSALIAVILAMTSKTICEN